MGLIPGAAKPQERKLKDSHKKSFKDAEKERGGNEVIFRPQTINFTNRKISPWK